MTALLYYLSSGDPVAVKGMTDATLLEEYLGANLAYLRFTDIRSENYSREKFEEAAVRAREAKAEIFRRMAAKHAPVPQQIRVRSLTKAINVHLNMGWTLKEAVRGVGATMVVTGQEVYFRVDT